MITKEELQAQIQEVARARAAQAKMNYLLRVARSVWDIEHEQMLSEVLQAQNEVKEAEDILRNMTLEIYHTTRDKHPAPEVGIQEGEKLIYEPGDAFVWAREHGICLELDAPAFEKMAKAPELRPGFVAVEKVVTATIATNIAITGVLNEIL